MIEAHFQFSNSFSEQKMKSCLKYETKNNIQ